MPNIANMNIGIGTDLGRLDSGLKQAQKSVTSFSSNVEKQINNISFSGLTGGMQNFGVRAFDANTAVRSLNSNFSKFKPTLNANTTAVTNFNRVIQDAPFGIIGVANNLEPMIQSFNNLKAQTGSTTGALKTLLTSAFTGPGALITTVSLASTLLIAFGDDLFSAGESAEEAEGMLDGLNNEIDVMVKAVERLADFDDPFGLKSLEIELTAIQSKQSVLENARDRIDDLTSAANRLRSEALTDEGEIVNESAFAEAEKLDAEAQSIAEKFGTTAQINEKLAELEKNRKETQQEINTTQSALNSGLVKEAEARAELIKQAKQQAQITEDDIIEADIQIEPMAFDVGPKLPLDELITADIDAEMDFGQSQALPMVNTLASLNQQLDFYQQKLLNVPIGGKQFNKLQARIAELKKQLEEAGVELEESGKVGQQAGMMISQAFAQALFQGRGLLGVVENLVAQFASKIFTQVLTAIITGGFGAGPSLGKAIFGGFFANGGKLLPGQVGIVGENGPEPIMATSSGAVIAPNSALGNQSVATNGMNRRTRKMVVEVVGRLNGNDILLSGERSEYEFR